MAFISDATFYFLTVLMIVFEEQGAERPKTVHHGEHLTSGTNSAQLRLTECTGTSWGLCCCSTI